MMAITDWPSNERPREKLMAQGSPALSDAELLAIFLRTGIRGKTAVDLARELLQKYGGLRALIETKREQFCQTRGLGLAKYAQLQAVLEIGRRYLQEPLKKGDALTSTYATTRYLMARLRGYQHEVFTCLFLDNRHRLIQCEELFHGTINTSCVYPREVVKRALHHNAAAVIFAHNHPSGIAEPSLADKQITQQLKQALELVEIRILDHIIIGDGQITSFAEKGLL